MIQKVCPECGGPVSHVELRLDEPAHVEPCMHYVSYDPHTMTIDKSPLAPGGKAQRT